MAERQCRIYYRTSDHRVIEAMLTTAHPQSRSGIPILTSGDSAFRPADVPLQGWIILANDNTDEAVERLTKARYQVIPTRMAAEPRGKGP